MEQLKRRGLIKDGCTISELFSMLQSDKKGKGILDDQLPSPINHLKSCVLENHDDWVDGLGKLLDEFAYQSVAITVDQALKQNISEMEKDMKTESLLVHFCSCSETTHRSVHEIEKQLREMRITIEAVKTLINLSEVYQSYKDQLSKMARDVEAKVTDLPQNTRPLRSSPDRTLDEAISKIIKIPNLIKKNKCRIHNECVKSLPNNLLDFVNTRPVVDKNSREEFSKMKKIHNFMKKNKHKIRNEAVKNMPQGVLEYVDSKPILNIMAKMLGYLSFICLKAKDGTMGAEDLKVFDYVDRIVRAGTISAFEHFSSQFANEIDQCTQAMQSFFDTGKVIFGEPSEVVVRDGEEVIVDQLTQKKCLTRVTYFCCALSGQILSKTQDLLELSTLFTDSVTRFLDFDIIEWVELVQVAQILKRYLESKEPVKGLGVTPSSTPSDDLSEFEIVSQNVQSTSTSAEELPNNLEESFPSIFNDDDDLPYPTFDVGIFHQLIYDAFTKTERLAAGGYGAVELRKHSHHGMVVVKVFHDNVVDEKVVKELENLKRLQNNPNIVTLIGFYYYSKEDADNRRIPPGCVMEYIPLSLHDVIHRRRDGFAKVFKHEYTLLLALEMIWSMASAFAAIHSLAFVHRDIKPENILVVKKKDKMNIKICDFGTLGVENVNQTSSIGTYKYFSPEIFIGRPYDSKTDVFSLAITIWELFHRRAPYDNASKNEVWEKIKLQERPIITSTAWRPVSDLVEKSWAHSSQDRPTMTEIEERAKYLVEGIGNVKDLAMTQICG